MKRMLSVCLAVAMVLMLTVSCLSVSAAELSADEQRIMTALKQSQTVPGTGLTYVIPASYINQAENYFLGHDTTKEQADQIIAYVNDGFAVCGKAESYATIPTDSTIKLHTCLKQSAKAQILDDGQKACALVGLDLVYNSKNNHVVIKDSAGNVLFDNTALVVKVTGTDATMLALIIGGAAVVLTGAVIAVVIVSRKRKFAA